MFLVGLEADLTTLRDHGRKTMVVGQVSVWIPLALGIALGYVLYPHVGTGSNEVAFCIFIGVAVSITAFPVLARILQETALFHTRIGAMSIACAAVGDVLAWLLLAGAVAVAGSASVATLGFTSAMMIGYLLVMVGSASSTSGSAPSWS
jgi:Kef-type K+ transport system membrane component KefB